MKSYLVNTLKTLAINYHTKSIILHIFLSVNQLEPHEVGGGGDLHSPLYMTCSSHFFSSTWLHEYSGS